MENQLFRQKSLDRISSPEQLHDYMRVTSPRLWMILTAIVILLGGFVVYAVTARLENTVTVPMSVNEYGSVTAVIPSDGQDNITVGMEVRIGGTTGRITSIEQGVRFLLRVAADGGEEQDDGTYLMAREDEDPDSEDTVILMVSVANGTYMIDPVYTDTEILKSLRNGIDMRMRFWTLDFSDEDISYKPGRLATVSGLGEVTIRTLTVTMDDPDQELKAGNYEAEIVTESTKPISFLWN